MLILPESILSDLLFLSDAAVHYKILCQYACHADASGSIGGALVAFSR